VQFSFAQALEAFGSHRITTAGSKAAFGRPSSRGSHKCFNSGRSSVFFPPNFCDVAQVAIIVYLAQFGDMKNMVVENLKHPFHIVGSCCDFIFFGHSFLNAQGICDRIYFSQNTFGNAENLPPKKLLGKRNQP
jgi:hypothetical protein